MNTPTGTLWKVVGPLVLSVALSACGSGGDGGGGGSTPSGTVVTGTVQAPSGQIVFENANGLFERFARFITTPVYAAISGLSQVPDGTQIQLGRLNATGTGFAPLATTTTNGGRYTFNLTSIGIQFSNDLIVRAQGQTGKEMRAFATSSTVDLDPGSELAVRLVIEQITSTPGVTLSRFTLKEVNDISVALKLLTTTEQLVGGIDLESTIATIRNQVNAQPDLLVFIAAAASDGQTLAGPGDVGNFVPFTQGSAWNFQGTHSETGQPTSNFQSTILVSGTRLVGSVTATVFSESNPDGLGKSEDTYRTKESGGITIHGNSDATDFVTPQVVPYQELQFPLQAGSSFQQVSKNGLDLGEDLDGDLINEKLNITSQVTVVDFSTVIVPAGTFQNSAKIESRVAQTAILSKNGATVTATGTQTVWFAPGVGPIKILGIITAAGFTETNSEELVGYVVNGQGKGSIPLTLASGVAAANSDTTNPGRSGIASDGNNYLLVSCRDLGISPGIFGVIITGGVAGQPFPIASRPCGSNIGIEAAFNGTNYLVVFSKDGLIRGVRVSPSGIVLDGGGGFAISTGTPATITNIFPDVAFDGANFLVVWSKFSGSAANIYGARVSPIGQVLGEFPISTVPPSQGSPVVAFDGTNFMVAWTDLRNGNGDIFGARVSSSGAVLDTGGFAIATGPLEDQNPALAFDGTNYFVVWLTADQSTFPPPTQTHGTRVTPTGNLLDGSPSSGGITINASPFFKNNPTVGFDGTNFLVAWEIPSFSINPPAGIFGARISPSGQIVEGQPNTAGISLSGIPDPAARFVYPANGSNGASLLLAWANNTELSGTTKSILGLLMFH